MTGAYTLIQSFSAFQYFLLTAYAYVHVNQEGGGDVFLVYEGGDPNSPGVVVSTGHELWLLSFSHCSIKSTEVDGTKVMLVTEVIEFMFDGDWDEAERADFHMGWDHAAGIPRFTDIFQQPLH